MLSLLEGRRIPTGAQYQLRDNGKKFSVTAWHRGVSVVVWQSFRKSTELSSLAARMLFLEKLILFWVLLFSAIFLLSVNN